MTAFSDFLEESLIDHVLRGQPYTAPGTVYIALGTAVFNDTGSAVEVSGTGYARVGVAGATASWSAPSGTSATTSENSNVIQFGTPGGDWGTVSHVGIYDAATAGNLLFHGSLGTNRVVQNLDPAPKFLAGAIGVKLD